jgi:hypothetical protein
MRNETNKNSTPTALRLACAFSAQMRQAVSSHDLRNIVDGNRLSGAHYCCASHNYCDAPEVMRSAWESVTTMRFEFDAVLVESAWAIARHHRFGL